MERFLPIGFIILLSLTIYLIKWPGPLFKSLTFRYRDGIVDYIVSIVLWVYVFVGNFTLIKLCERILR